MQKKQLWFGLPNMDMQNLSHLCDCTGFITLLLKNLKLRWELQFIELNVDQVLATVTYCDFIAEFEEWWCVNLNNVLKWKI